jgi:8-oxo-dGTP pyrophosphatase MutT (NUDIX family)
MADIDHFIAAKTKMRCQPAAAALIVLPDRRYVLQLRDNLPTVFFPGHWGAFGGAMNDGETPLETLRRELQEELAVDVTEDQISYVTRLDFDLSFIGQGVIGRWFYEVRMTEGQFGALKLGEGAAVAAFGAEEALTTLRMTPYDKFALWIHWSRDRIS